MSVDYQPLPVSLRDYFAAQAIPDAIPLHPVSVRFKVRALLGLSYNGPSVPPAVIAAQAYAIADAMLAERAKQQPTALADHG